MNKTKRKIIANNIKRLMGSEVFLSKESGINSSRLDDILYCRKDITKQEIEKISKALTCDPKDITRVDVNFFYKL